MSTKKPGSAAPWLDEHEERAWRAFRRMMIAVRTATVRDLAETDLSEPDYEVLSTLAECPEVTSTLHEQATKMGWSRSRLSRHAGRMETRGLIRRAPDPADGRGCLLILTELGRDTLRSATPVHLESVRRHFADPLDTDDLTDLIRIGDKIMSAGRPPENGADGAQG
ncbi:MULTISPECIES: MarR family winged helix-turn-helix transcriptional regulator [Nocardiopsis]|uniref:MarR family transcriptional regulator n=1 Tax=Nocardiopsis alba TaxID=53437 RepID=A0A7K2IZ77_9ACTN|nr:MULTISPECIES: MarR family transcriptional regulator [Nocardiopsis]MEC3891587.1 MarR family transcriptional regulator [Nocardiopsis sp. LDBS1602]MYR35075.1 MarR family transcriptional regulator [Nocardiopsis alba]